MALSTRIVDQAFIYILVVCALLFALILFFTVFFVLRYRRSQSPQPENISGNAVLEIGFVIVSTLIALTMFFYGLAGFQFMRNQPTDGMSIDVIARQWSWEFDYENGKKAPRLVVPVDTDIRLGITSEDVIHSLFVPAFRIKQDAVPGLKTRAWFRAVTPGTYDILCAEYCGVLHSHMITQVVVVPQEQFDEWYASDNP